MEIKGKVIQLLPLATGTSAKGQWKKQEFILEIPGQYVKKVALSIWGAKVDEFNVRVGELLCVSVDLESREHNSRWFTEARAWKIQRTDPGAQQQSNAGQQQSNSGFASAPSADTASDDLPF